ncbi:hypothetical protein [Embleya sp. NBC_00896]|uniref:hypothetical protein n=1 Tax=Embleya sp. NBC_00896 TaxID=2975961 RepID=UPI0038703B49|nr:hypothetical protein OG928_30165 [Embleya sp. NBC_00896]
MEICCAPHHAIGAAAPVAVAEDPGHTRAPTPERSRDQADRLTLTGGAERMCGKLAALADEGVTEPARRPLGPDPVREFTAFTAAAAPI